MTLPKKVDVVVVGAGPTGLTLACTLRAADLDVLVLDKVAEGANTSRAAVIHARTLEVLDELDVTPRLIAEGVVVPIFTVRDRRAVLARLNFSDLPTPYPYTLMLPQSRTEAILAERLAELDGNVHRPWTVTSVDTTRQPAPWSPPQRPRDDRRPSRPATSSAPTASTASSEPAPESASPATATTHHSSWPTSNWTGPCPPTRCNCSSHPQDWSWSHRYPVDDTASWRPWISAPETPDAGLVQALLDERGPGGAHVSELAWSSRFRVQHRLADTYRSGALFLAGDAAHVHSPAGGQGMNTGIQDAVDLGHTLIEVLSGQAADTALDGYQQRRRPVAQQVVRLTDRATRLATLQGPISAQRSQPGHVRRQPNTRGATTHSHPDRRTSKHERRHRTHKKIQVRTFPGPHPVAMGA